MDIVFALLIGLLLGAALGWLWARRAPTPAPARTNSTNRVLAELRPIREVMGHLAGEVRALEEDRTATLAGLNAQMQAMVRTSTRLTDRTNELVNSLRSPQVRGRWGEIQLERVVELGGMVRHCDFDSQVTAKLGDRTVRPDLVVRLAGGRQIVVDAKVPYGAYLDAIESQDPEEHQALLRRHAHQLRTHVTQLAARDYISAFSPTPEFVVLFVPADPFLDAALSTAPDLLEYAFSHNVIIATPSTLFALLRTVALGWRQEDYSDKARQIHFLGRQLYSRLNILGDHYNKLGLSLERAVDAYNATLGSMNARVMVTARKLADMEVSARTDEPPTTLHPVANTPRQSPVQPEEERSR
ncbi:DNA recombination protein RmuC [Corynebacterium uberis]|uniref:DNA recombination protein RmuC n=1 Tax=Corynebacterium TaxID=1716 RepID=UPI001D09E70D|nr:MULTISPECIES: DNA recombination protein RmuC [Corynebacterium]MCZ9308899.1 DNA recombination protein RmuC [Corynebacterium sp. c6VSa_13]UDL74627.1 DNA recombination protein RmuC [Corynebacterium uberis]UDL76539.1 DNA recombination protein RmuC [Corynebacterium uberis]UDL78751.1 DNA recombination protein RmuC [Corynebacterium uberis]UDL81030.1 DNA recombination protein RmuC [Corynebacterium uberis]